MFFFFTFCFIDVVFGAIGFGNHMICQIKVPRWPSINGRPKHKAISALLLPLFPPLPFPENYPSQMKFSALSLISPPTILINQLSVRRYHWTVCRGPFTLHLSSPLLVTLAGGGTADKHTSLCASPQFASFVCATMLVCSCTFHFCATAPVPSSVLVKSLTRALKRRKPPAPQCLNAPSCSISSAAISADLASLACRGYSKSNTMQGKPFTR